MQTPTSPVNLAWAQAMKAASSSWRACTNSTFSFSPVQRSHDAVDAVARIAVDPAHPPVIKPLHQIIAGRRCHEFLPICAEVDC